MYMDKEDLIKMVSSEVAAYISNHFYGEHFDSVIPGVEVKKSRTKKKDRIILKVALRTFDYA